MASLPPCMAMVGGSGKEIEVVVDVAGVNDSTVAESLGIICGGSIDEYRDDKGKKGGVGTKPKNDL